MHIVRSALQAALALALLSSASLALASTPGLFEAPAIAGGTNPQGTFLTNSGIIGGYYQFQEGTPNQEQLPFLASGSTITTAFSAFGGVDNPPNSETPSWYTGGPFGIDVHPPQQPYVSSESPFTISFANLLPISATPVGMSTNGSIAANVEVVAGTNTIANAFTKLSTLTCVNGNCSFSATPPGYFSTGAVYNPSTQTTRYYGEGTYLTGINAAGAVAGNSTQVCTGSPESCTRLEATTPFYSAPGSNVIKPLAALSNGGLALAINVKGQIAGIDTYDGVGFVTAANGGAVTLLGTGSGAIASSAATSINDFGQVGGYVTNYTLDPTGNFYTTQDEAFLTTVNGGMQVGLGVGSSTDSTATEFVNDSGQAIILDETTDTYYFYSGGVLYTFASLFAPDALSGFSDYAIAGFNNAGQVLLNGDLNGTDPSFLANIDLSGVSLSTPGAVDVRQTQAYLDFASVDGAPPASFFGDPADAVSTPEPSLAGLFALGGFAAMLRRRRKSA
jgi:hypothetical protein